MIVIESSGLKIMDSNTDKKLKLYLDLICYICVLVATILVFLFIGQGQAESDTLWHIKAGQWALENGIPYTDPFSWTMQGEDWFAHEWLWEVCVAWIYGKFGHVGTWLFTCLGVGLFGAALWGLLRRRCSVQRASLLFVLVMFSSAIFWNTRPHPMAQALFAGTAFVLLNCPKKPWLLYLLPPVIMLWAIVHGSAPLGVLLAAFYWLITVRGINLSWASVYAEQLSRETSRVLGLCTIASLAASIINPRGIDLWAYMFKVSGDPLMSKYITEWHSPNFHDITFWPIIFVSLCLFSLLALRGNLSERKIPFFEFVLMCGFFFLALKQMRHAPYFYFTSALVLAPLIGERVTRAVKHSAGFKTGLAAFSVLLFILLSYLNPPTWLKNDRFFPAAAVDYLEQNQLVNNVFNEYGYGGYLIWRGIPPFIDGRADLYTFDSDIFKDYLGAKGSLESNTLPQEYLDKYDIHTIIIRAGSKMDCYLKYHPGWSEVFRDEGATIYKKEIV